MIKYPLCFGAYRHAKLIDDDPSQKARRSRNEARLRSLKKSHRLFESIHDKPASAGGQPRTDEQQLPSAYLRATGWPYLDPVERYSIGNCLGIFG